MRGLYRAEYLTCLSTSFAQKRGDPALEVGKAFDLIVGTSTGAMIGCALAAGVGPDRLAHLYREHGPSIFPVPVPQVSVSAGGFRRFRAIINDFRNSLDRPSK